MPKKYWNRNSPSFLIALTLALLTWLLFYPGIFSADSLYTYSEASTGKFTDLRSPFITLMVFILLKISGSINLITLFQCLLGFFGIRQLSVAVASLFVTDKPTREWIACIVLLLFSSPITPMPIYFATLWDDTWLIIFLVWSVALLIEFSKETNAASNRNNYPKVLLLIILIAAVMLSRPNSPILYPALILVFSSILSRQVFSRKTILFVALGPIIIYLLTNIFYYKVLGVKHVHHERISFALDSASMLTYNPTICQELSLRSCKLVNEKFPSEFIAGDGAIDHTLSQGSIRPEPGFVELAASSFVVQDLWSAATHYPVTYGIVKVLNFLDYIRPRNQYYFQSYIHPNNFNLAFIPQFKPVRDRFFLLLYLVYKHPTLKYISFVHFPWLLINLSGIVYWSRFVHKADTYSLMRRILYVPAVYYFSYLLAMTASEFRFMYPSALLVQVMFMTLIILGIKNSLRRLWKLAGRFKFSILLLAIPGKLCDKSR